jgi:hypothetical protein
MAPFRSGADPAYHAVESVALALCPASHAWIVDGQWTFENEWPLLLFVPVMNGFLYSGLAAVVIEGRRRHRWLAIAVVTLIVGWFVLVAVDYGRWLDLIKRGAAE